MGRGDYSKYIGNKYEDRFGNIWEVRSVFRKEYSNAKRTICECIREHDGLIKEIRLDVVKGYSGKDRNEYILKDDMIIGKINSGYEFYINKDDYDIVKDYMWHCNSGGYLFTNYKGKKIAMHRLIMGVTNKNIHIDHKNNKRNDNRRSNLRETNNHNNSMNKSVCRSNTGYIGIHKNKNNKYESSIKYNYKKINLGTFENLDEAIVARLMAEIKYFKDYSPQKHLFKDYGLEEY